MTEWTKEYLSDKPEQLQLIAPGLYIQRRNIAKTVDDMSEDKTERWECESREITFAEYDRQIIDDNIPRIDSLEAATDDIVLLMAEIIGG